jgi:hypothetical protein
MFFYPCVLRAQSTNASLTGRVTDPSKAAIADARITAINTGTNIQNYTASNSPGEYFLANLPPGSYRIEVEKSGFKKLVRPDVILHVQDALAIDFEMAVGSVSDTVTVQAGSGAHLWIQFISHLDRLLDLNSKSGQPNARGAAVWNPCILGEEVGRDASGASFLCSPLMSEVRCFGGGLDTVDSAKFAA